MERCLNSLNMSGVAAKVPFGSLKLLQAWIIVLVFSPATPGYNWNHPAVERRELMVQTLAPSFDEMTTEVVARVGQTLLLPCTVKNLGSKVVSWIRSKDLHILTSGRHTFTGDSRFESVHSDSSGDFWGLRIRGVHVSDTGQYECQVNTEPKMSLAISLIVTDSGGHNSDASNSKWVSQALIKGPDAVYVQNGSPVTFTCEISPLSLQSGAYGLFFTTKPPVRWLHDWKEVSFEYQRNNISIETEYGDNDQRILSRIHLPTVSWKDSGQYTCMQPSTKPGSVKLIVVEGEHSEAMQRDFPIISSVATSRFQFLYIISILINFM